MIVAVLSDIHSNYVALAAVLAEADDKGAEETWFLGDLVGYGPFPYQAWEHLTAGIPRCTVAVLGNHEASWIGHLEALTFYAGDGEDGLGKAINPSLNEIARFSEELNRAAVTDVEHQLLDWFRARPLTASPRPGVHVAHEAVLPDSPGETLERNTRTAVDAERQIERLRACTKSDADFPRLLLVGHTHRQTGWRRTINPQGQPSWLPLMPQFGLQPDGQQRAVTPPGGNSERAPYGMRVEPLLDGDPEQPKLVNPGSVGFPRDGARAGEGWAWARYALLDWDVPGGGVEFRSVPYPTEGLTTALKQGGYPSEITGWLERE